jgi:hypothetical protein
MDVHHSLHPSTLHNHNVIQPTKTLQPKPQTSGLISVLKKILGNNKEHHMAQVRHGTRTFTMPPHATVAHARVMFPTCFLIDDDSNNAYVNDDEVLPVVSYSM